MSGRALVALSVVFGLLLAACDSGEAELSTTSTLVTSQTETTSQETTTTSDTAGEATSTSTTLVGQAVGEYEVTARIATENGEILYLVVPTGAYTDVDIENFIGDLKEADPELWGAEIFDDADAVDAFTTAEAQRTPEQEALLGEHHFASLIGGDTVKFRGPFSEFGEFIIGS